MTATVGVHNDCHGWWVGVHGTNATVGVPRLVCGMTATGVGSKLV